MESFYFDFFVYCSKSFLWSNQFTNEPLFLIISFETLFQWHAWNCQGLEKAWMSPIWTGLWHKMCLGFP